jgi:hypothetical protein
MTTLSPAAFDALLRRITRPGRYCPRVAKVLSTTAPWDAGCVYSIRRSIDMLDQITKLNGLKGDWIYPDMHPVTEDDVDLFLEQ